MTPKINHPRTAVDAGRRAALGFLGGAWLLGLKGCCAQRPFPKAQIPSLRDARAEPAFLAPRAARGAAAQAVSCIDVHAHFFNASDVTVYGYLAGPVAHSFGGAQGELLKLLAPLADAIAGLAPTAKEEYDELNRLSARVSGLSEDNIDALLMQEIKRHRRTQSERLNDLLNLSDGKRFRSAYETSQKDVRAQGFRADRLRVKRIDGTSLQRAMELGEMPADAAAVRRRPIDETYYGEGVLAFIGYMLSYRWANLQSYKKVFTEREQSVRVNRVLGALVDFDRWLECPPRSAHEDQIRLHARMSALSRGYMKPLVAYNPWTDVVDAGRSRERVRAAMESGVFVGAKIYPANGFRPWGNTVAQEAPGRPTHQQINEALKRFWEMCIDLKIPVMAHTGQSMGKNDEHDALGGPEGWEALIDAQAKEKRSPRVNLGHFGGDDNRNQWTRRMADLMARPHAEHVYGDLGFWTELRCAGVDPSNCHGAERLRAVLDMPIGNSERVADRVLYGSDWLMLSRAPDWGLYSTYLHDILRAIAPGDVERIFRQNALRCFYQGSPI